MLCRSFDNLEVPKLQKTSTFWIHLMFYGKFAVINLRVVESWSPWRHIRDVSQKWRGPDPPPPPCRQKSEIGLTSRPPLSEKTETGLITPPPPPLSELCVWNLFTHMKRRKTKKNINFRQKQIVKTCHIYRKAVKILAFFAWFLDLVI